MPRNLKRYYGAGHFHFITCSCYQRHPWLGARRRDLFLTILEQARQRFRFVVIGYVVMPEHFHLLISEPEKGDPSLVMIVLKQRFARRVLSQLRKQRSGQRRLWESPEEKDHFWQRLFYGFNVWSERKRAREVVLHARQSGEAWSGLGTRAVAMEQLPSPCLRRVGPGAGERAVVSAVEIT